MSSDKKQSVESKPTSPSVGIIEEPEKLNWDKEALFKRVLGKEKLVNSLVSMFVSNTPKHVQQLKDAIEQNDAESVRHNAHTIKGIAANLSVLKVQEQAALLEIAAKNGDNNEFEAISQKMFIEVEHALDLFQEYLGNDKAEVGGDIVATSQVREFLTSIKTSIEDGSYIAPDELTLCDGSFSDSEVATGMKNLKNAVMQFDVDLSLSIISEIEPLLETS